MNDWQDNFAYFFHKNISYGFLIKCLGKAFLINTHNKLLLRTRKNYPFIIIKFSLHDNLNSLETRKKRLIMRKSVFGVFDEIALKL